MSGRSGSWVPVLALASAWATSAFAAEAVYDVRRGDTLVYETTIEDEPFSETRKVLDLDPRKSDWEYRKQLFDRDGRLVLDVERRGKKDFFQPEEIEWYRETCPLDRREWMDTPWGRIETCHVEFLIVGQKSIFIATVIGDVPGGIVTWESEGYRIRLTEHRRR